MNTQTPFLLYKTANNDIKVDVRLEDQVLWLNQKQISELFSANVPAIAKHIKNIFDDVELTEATISKMEIVQKVRDIRISERFFYQKIKDIYTTSIDYDPKDEKTIAFFKIVQDKLLWAISSQTAAELVHSRVDVNLPLLGMQSFDKKSAQSISKKDLSIAKNYLNEKEIKLLGLLVEQYLAFAETMAEQKTPMHMNNWIQRLDAIISLNGRELLSNAGQISHDMAMAKSALVYEAYKESEAEEGRSINLLELEKDMKMLRGK
ncbi:MAG TPA: hypothetical protein EYG98_04560 [Sulfurovum sp.]|nr:hypothetical protein [Sulfurovum sp.]